MSTEQDKDSVVIVVVKSKHDWAVVMAQLTELCSLNPVIGQILQQTYLLLTVEKTKLNNNNNLSNS